jgi:hypothetical protein
MRVGLAVHPAVARAAAGTGRGTPGAAGSAAAGVRMRRNEVQALTPQQSAAARAD